MFTGLVECVGTLQASHQGLSPQADPGRQLTIELPEIREGLSLGDSVAINGCCLTVIALAQGNATFQAGPETLLRTNLGQLVPGDRVNIERALLAGGRLGGHIVQGHIDGTAVIKSRTQQGEWEIVWFECGSLARTMVPKGSVAVDGVSLTVCDVTDDSFSVMLIPHTLDVTTLGEKGVGAVVNMETDILGKYVMKMVEQVLGADRGFLADKLREIGTHL